MAAPIDLRGFLAGGAPPPGPADGAAADPGDGAGGDAEDPPLGGPGPADEGAADQGPPFTY